MPSTLTLTGLWSKFRLDEISLVSIEMSNGEGLTPNEPVSVELLVLVPSESRLSEMLEELRRRIY